MDGIKNILGIAAGAGIYYSLRLLDFNFAN
jgi:hypothetical protein